MFRLLGLVLGPLVVLATVLVDFLEERHRTSNQEALASETTRTWPLLLSMAVLTVISVVCCPVFVLVSGTVLCLSDEHAYALGALVLVPFALLPSLPGILRAHTVSRAVMGLVVLRAAGLAWFYYGVLLFSRVLI